MGKKLIAWVQNTKLILSVVKIFIGVIIGVGTAVPVFYGVASDLLNKNEAIAFIDVKYKMDCLTWDINSEFYNDIRPFDLEYVMDRYALLKDDYKTKALESRMENINDFYKNLIKGNGS